MYYYIYTKNTIWCFQVILWLHLFCVGSCSGTLHASVQLKVIANLTASVPLKIIANNLSFLNEPFTDAQALRRPILPAIIWSHRFAYPRARFCSPNRPPREGDSMRFK